VSIRPWLLALLGAGCATMNTARPLSPGQHAVGLTVGGGLVRLGPPIPLPNVVLEGRHGVAQFGERAMDVGWGLNATAIPFGIAQIHGSAGLLLAPQRGAVPAVSVANRLWLASNVFGLGTHEDPKLQFWGADQVEVTASWLAKDQLPYVALAQYIDFGNPTLTLTPAVGCVFDFRDPGGFVLQTEARWFGLGVPDQAVTVDWVPGVTGVIGVSVGVSRTFGSAR
jgi:hypothetical protein